MCLTRLVNEDPRARINYATQSDNDGLVGLQLLAEQVENVKVKLILNAEEDTTEGNKCTTTPFTHTWIPLENNKVYFIFALNRDRSLGVPSATQIVGTIRKLLLWDRRAEKGLSSALKFINCNLD